MATLPMFPLGSVLFPHALMPLHVFEPRYRQMITECLGGSSEFGVVLIERGSEVGGGDVRFDVGTVARILRAGELEDGRWVLVTAGTERLRVREWLDDDPYPRADVERVAEPAASPTPTLVDDVGRRLRRVLALRAELGDPAAGVDVSLADDPVRASFEAAALASVGPLDAQALLELDDAGARLARVAQLLDEEVPVLEFRLADGEAST
jgi:Lon protease-like protein